LPEEGIRAVAEPWGDSAVGKMMYLLSPALSSRGGEGARDVVVE
jgi:hypothetical protein